MVKLQLGEWLKADDLPQDKSTTITFTNEGSYVDGEINGKPITQFVIGITDGQQEKQWSMNKTSQRAVASHYGEESKEWVGKTAQLYTQTENVQGQMRRVIYAEARP